MKTFLKSFMDAIARLAADESGEFLSARRKAHILYGNLYSGMDNGAKTDRIHSIAQLATPTAGELLSARRAAHLLHGNIYTQLDLAVKTERRQPRKALAHRYYDLFGEKMIHAAG
ncbi:MAG: hypothetical protein Q7U85_09790 [Rhodocyclaceae bacterium]|nr:hypothetical protein [Rhodocyclaceae bacterium]